MAEIRGAVYDPPRADLPHLAVLFDLQGEVLVARVVPNVASGDAFLQTVMKEYGDKLGLKYGSR